MASIASYRLHSSFVLVLVWFGPLKLQATGSSYRRVLQGGAVDGGEEVEVWVGELGIGALARSLDLIHPEVT